MTATVQDFNCTAGDSSLPIFTVVDGSGNAINISSVTAIVFTVQETVESAPVITKTLAGGGIALVSGGTTGKFQVALLSSDLEPLAGYFLYQAKITDASGNVSTVSSGTMRVIRSVPA